jgi:hypothetical protein
LIWILKAERTTVNEIDGIKGKVGLRVWNDTEDNTKGINGDKMDMNDKRKPEDRPSNNNTGLDKIDKKHVESEGEQHRVSNKLKVDLHIT